MTPDLKLEMGRTIKGLGLEIISVREKLLVLLEQSHRMAYPRGSEPADPVADEIYGMLRETCPGLYSRGHSLKRFGHQLTVAPATFNGVQDGFGIMPSFELWTLTAAIPGYPAGTTISRATIEAAGYALPERTS